MAPEDVDIDFDSHDIDSHVLLLLLLRIDLGQRSQQAHGQHASNPAHHLHVSSHLHCSPISSTKKPSDEQPSLSVTLALGSATSQELSDTQGQSNVVVTGRGVSIHLMMVISVL